MDGLPGGGTELSPAEFKALHARWSSCWTPGQVAQHLAGITTPWYVAAGWALDLFRGAQTREHADIEIAVPAATFPEIRDRFPGYAGRIWENAAPDALTATHLQHGSCRNTQNQARHGGRAGGACLGRGPRP